MGTWKNNVFTLVPSENRTRAPCPGTSLRFFCLTKVFLPGFSSIREKFCTSERKGRKISWQAPSTRQVQKVHIGHDSKGRNKGVFVEEIEVTAPDAPKVIFPCRCWLAENEDDGKTARVIVPGESITQPYDSKYSIKHIDLDSLVFETWQKNSWKARENM